MYVFMSIHVVNIILKLSVKNANSSKITFTWEKKAGAVLEISANFYYLGSWPWLVSPVVNVCRVNTPCIL